jgi:hypothetical protein
MPNCNECVYLFKTHGVVVAFWSYDPSDGCKMTAFTIGYEARPNNSVIYSWPGKCFPEYVQHDSTDPENRCIKRLRTRPPFEKFLDLIENEGGEMPDATRGAIAQVLCSEIVKWRYSPKRVQPLTP